MDKQGYAEFSEDRMRRRQSKPHYQSAIIMGQRDEANRITDKLPGKYLKYKH